MYPGLRSLAHSTFPLSVSWRRRPTKRSSSSSLGVFIMQPSLSLRTDNAARIAVSISQRKLPFPPDAIGAAMGEEGGIQFNGVARLEARFAQEPGGQFQRGDVACVHVDAGEVDDARGRLAPCWPPQLGEGLPHLTETM